MNRALTGNRPALGPYYCPVFWGGLLLLLVAVRAPAVEMLQVALDQREVVISEPSYLLCGAAPSGVDHVTVKTSAGEFDLATPTSGFSVSLDLAPGENQVAIEIPGGETLEYRLWRPESEKPSPEKRAHLTIHPDEVIEMEECGTCHPQGAQRQGLWSDIRAVEPNCLYCHDSQFEFQYLHGPAAAGSCVSCHNPHGTTQPHFLIATGRKLCDRCHEALEKPGWKAQHFPFEEGECGECHQSHGGNTPVFSSGKTIAETCFACHDQEEMGRSSKHIPVAEGECMLCHKPHGSEYGHLARAEGSELCLDCHSDIREMLSLSVEHPPAQVDCLDCHQPHSADHAPLLKRAEASLCADCHDEVGEEAAQAQFKHPPAAEGDCGQCHGIHGANFARLLLQERPQLCYGCHEKIGERISQKRLIHAPVEGGECENCHLAHGSGHPRLLTAYLNPEFYAEYRKENYEFCFECHDDGIAEEETTLTATEFRDSNRNLHYVHVHRQKGRTCRSCHDPHASNQERLIREGTPFGDWEIPVVFTLTPTGGKCSTGCHRVRVYDRTRK